MALTLRRRLAPPPHISAPAPPWPHDSSPGWRHLSLPSCFCTEYDTFLFVPLPLSLSLCFSARPVDTASSQDGPGRLFTDKTKPKNKKNKNKKKVSQLWGLSHRLRVISTQWSRSHFLPTSVPFPEHLSHSESHPHHILYVHDNTTPVQLFTILVSFQTLLCGSDRLLHFHASSTLSSRSSCVCVCVCVRVCLFSWEDSNDVNCPKGLYEDDLVVKAGYKTGANRDGLQGRGLTLLWCMSLYM